MAPCGSATVTSAGWCPPLSMPTARSSCRRNSARSRRRLRLPPSARAVRGRVGNGRADSGRAGKERTGKERTCGGPKGNDRTGAVSRCGGSRLVARLARRVRREPGKNSWGHRRLLQGRRGMIAAGAIVPAAVPTAAAAAVTTPRDGEIRRNRRWAASRHPVQLPRDPVRQAPARDRGRTPVRRVVTGSAAIMPAAGARAGKAIRAVAIRVVPATVTRPGHSNLAVAEGVAATSGRVDGPGAARLVDPAAFRRIRCWPTSFAPRCRLPSRRPAPPPRARAVNQALPAMARWPTAQAAPAAQPAAQAAQPAQPAAQAAQPAAQAAQPAASREADPVPCDRPAHPHLAALLGALDGRDRWIPAGCLFPDGQRHRGAGGACGGRHPGHPQRERQRRRRSARRRQRQRLGLPVHARRLPADQLARRRAAGGKIRRRPRRRYRVSLSDGREYRRTASATTPIPTSRCCGSTACSRGALRGARQLGCD